MFPATLKTPRLLLRPLALRDAPLIFGRYAGDPEVCRFLSWRPHTGPEQTEAYIRARSAAETSRTFAITRHDEADVIGTFDLRRSGPGRLDYGYVLARDAWGQGLMTEALAEAVNWALHQPGIFRIGGVCDAANLASARVMEKAGLEREGLLRRWAMHPNVSDEPRDCLSYAKVR